MPTDPAEPNLTGSQPDNINLSEKYHNSWITDPKDILAWCTSQGVTPMPCQWGTKKAVREVWKSTLIKEFPDCGSYLIDHPARREIIKNYWKLLSKQGTYLRNISLVTSWNSICSIDCDTQETMDLAETLLDAPKVLSKRGGKFILRLVGEAPSQIQYKTPGGEVGLEFFSKGKHVLIYGMHPDEVPYKFYPKSIPSMTWAEILPILIRIATQTGLSEESVSKTSSKKKIAPDIISKAYAARGSKNISEWFNLPYPTPPINGIPVADGIQGTHPIHGSDHSHSNYAVKNDGSWYCHRCRSGGDRFMWFLVEHGIADCSDIGRVKEGGGWGGLTQQQKHEANELLRSMYPERYEEYRKLAPKTDRVKKVPSSTETVIEILPESLHNHHITLLNGLARIGKSTFGIKCLLDAGQGLFIANTHSIMENAMRLMRKMWEDHKVFDKTAVCVVGKMYSCNDDRRQGRCDGCPKAPKNPSDEEKPGISVLLLDSIAKEILQRVRMITKDNIPAEYCPYHIMMHAQENADYVFLVPFFSTVDDDTRRVRPRGLAVIDEGPTCDHYRAPCAEIALYERKVSGGGKVDLAWDNKYSPWFSKLKEYVAHRLDDEKGNPPKRRMGDVDACITEILGKFLLVYSILVQFNRSPTEEGFKTANEELKPIDFSNTYSRDFKMNILRKVEEYSQEASVDSNAMNELFVIALHPGASAFSWQGDNPSKLFFVSDDSLYLLPDFEKLLVIGTSQGERFIKDYAMVRNITDITKLYVTGFPYADNYLFLRLAGLSEDKLKKIKEKDSDADFSPVKIQERQLRRFIQSIQKTNKNSVRRYPALVITASKEKQTTLYSRMQSGSVMLTDHGTDGAWRDTYIPGNLGIYTQNSRISRGLDIPFIDNILLDHGEFATPAITARIQYLKEQIGEKQWAGLQEGKTDVDVSEIEDEIEDLVERRAAIQTDEITNNVLRTAPIPSDETSLKRLNTVVLCDVDYQKLDSRIRNLTKSVLIYNDENVNNIVAAVNSIHHGVIPVDLNLDRPSIIPLEKSDALALPTSLSLSEQADRIIRYDEYHVQAIDRDTLPYEKVINIVAGHTALSTMNKHGKSNKISNPALVKYILSQKGLHTSEKIAIDCITLGVSDRLLLSERTDGKLFYRLHPNVIAYRLGLPLGGPDYPDNLNLIQKKKI